MTLDAMALARSFGLFFATALGWLYWVDGVVSTWNDYVGVALALAGAGVIALGHRASWCIFSVGLTIRP